MKFGLEIGGLDVAVDDAFGVGGIEGVGDFDGDVEDAFQLERYASLRGKTNLNSETACRVPTASRSTGDSPWITGSGRDRLKPITSSSALTCAVLNRQQRGALGTM